jgi:hypothetical protein
MQNLLKGLLISTLLLAGLAVAFSQIDMNGIEEFGALMFLIPTFPIIGLLLGYAATKIQTRRFLKLFLLGLLFIYIAAIGLSFILIITDDSKMIQGFEIVSSVFFLATVGFFIYGVFLIPILLFGIYVLERWTRQKE